MPKYTLIEAKDGYPASVLREDDNGEIWSIPCDEANSDYQAYLASLDEQQEALEAK